VWGQEVRARIGRDVARSEAPGGEGPHLADPLPDGVVRQRLAVTGDPPAEVGLGEIGWVLGSRRREQTRQLRALLLAGARVRIPARVGLDEVGDGGRSLAVADDSEVSPR
jgi:hypothetical protein